MSNCVARFKAGDKVRVKSSRLDTYWYADKIGEVVTILAYDPEDGYCCVEYGSFCTFDTADIEHAQETPKAETWKDGLPQVGTEFEYSFDGEHWFWGITTYVVGDSGVVAHCNTEDGEYEQYLDESDVMFRPLKGDRECAIEEMMFIADPTDLYPNSTRLQCERLYNAGWRKVD